MAKVTKIVDDITGEYGATTREVIMDGELYEIDLTDESVKTYFRKDTVNDQDEWSGCCGEENIHQPGDSEFCLNDETGREECDCPSNICYDETEESYLNNDRYVDRFEAIANLINSSSKDILESDSVKNLLENISGIKFHITGPGSRIKLKDSFMKGCSDNE